MLIAHDLGTSGNKASLHGDSGELLDSVTVNYQVQFRAGGLAEQDPHDWYQAVIGATEELLDRTPQSRSQLKGIVLSGQMMGAVFLDRDKQNLRPALIWADTRSNPQVQQMLEWRSQWGFYSSTGNRMNVAYTLPKVMWVRDTEPEVWRHVRHVCWAKDYVTLRLTGRLCTDPSDASGSDCYNLSLGVWDEGILAAAGLEVNLFPEIVGSTSVAGDLLPEVRKYLGLSRDVPVVVGGGDGPISAVGAGSVSVGNSPFVCLGTSSWVAVASDSPALDPKMRLLNFRHVVPELFVPTATMQTGGAVMPWVRHLMGNDNLDVMMDRAADAPAAADGLFFMPYLLGERSPIFDPDATGAFLGLRMHHGSSNLVKAAMEGVGFNLGQCLEAMRESGLKIDQIDAIGGGAISDTWLQVLADIWGIPVRRRTIVSEANSLGAAITAAVALGLVDGFQDVRSLSRVTATFEPDSNLTNLYREASLTFGSAYTHLAPWFQEARQYSAGE